MISANYVTVEYDGIVYVTLGGNTDYEITADCEIVDVWELPRNNCGQFMEVTI